MPLYSPHTCNNDMKSIKIEKTPIDKLSAKSVNLMFTNKFIVITKLIIKKGNISL